MSADALAGRSVAVLGLDVTSQPPELITEACVLHLVNGVIVAGPLTWWVQVDAPAGHLRPGLRASLPLAPPWAEVADRLTGALAGRLLVVRDAERYATLRRHLPAWQPPAVATVRDLAEQVWPGLDGYDLGPLTQWTGITLVPRPGPGAVAEAHALASLLLALTRAGGRLPDDEERTTDDA
jgi:hypothetical protein